jgi:hypothetical protein
MQARDSARAAAIDHPATQTQSGMTTEWNAIITTMLHRIIIITHAPWHSKLGQTSPVVVVPCAAAHTAAAPCCIRYHLSVLFLTASQGEGGGNGLGLWCVTDVNKVKTS